MGEDVDKLALAFVAPLGAKHDGDALGIHGQLVCHADGARMVCACS